MRRWREVGRGKGEEGRVLPLIRRLGVEPAIVATGLILFPLPSSLLPASGWSKAAPLPDPLQENSATTVQAPIYVVARISTTNESTNDHHPDRATRQKRERL